VANNIFRKYAHVVLVVLKIDHFYKFAI